MRLPLFALLACCVLASACSSPRTRDVPVTSRSPVPTVPPQTSTMPPGMTPEAPQPAPAAEPPAPRPPQPARQLADGSQVPAVKGLIASADRALARGEVDLAAVNLERAQRLAPQSAEVYRKLAQVRLRQERPAEAEQLARRALAFSPAAAQQAELWRLIASARRQNGQPAAAQEAEARAAALEAGSAP